MAAILLLPRPKPYRPVILQRTLRYPRGNIATLGDLSREVPSHEGYYRNSLCIRRIVLLAPLSLSIIFPVMEQLKLLEQWHKGLRIQNKSHVQAAAKFDRDARWLSIAALVASTIVGTSLFTDANSTLSAGWKIAAGVLSLIAAVLSAVQGSL